MALPDTCIRPVIMCGGSGTRLWPASREAYPKQFATLLGTRSTFQDTVLRFAGDPAFGKPLIVTNKALRFMAERQLNEIGVAADMLLEPVARDSGPAILAAALAVERADPKALALVLAADHVVLDPAGFRLAAKNGAKAALSGEIVTFGIVPTHPATGYGYIAKGAALDGDASRVARFVEKPDETRAKEYIAQGYLWNSGNFLFRPATVIAEYETADKVSVEAVRAALDEAAIDLGAPVLDLGKFSQARKISFDFAVMEKTTHAAVIAGDFGWSDIGDWEALWAISERDEENNRAEGEAMFFDSRGNYVSSERQLVAMLGADNLVVVANRDAILVADKARAGEVKGIVETLRKTGRQEATNHLRVHRPWGWYETLELMPHFQAKRIVVYPGCRLSLQKHAHRAEHWVVVKGVARVTIDGTVADLAANQSTYIPLGAVHRLENPGAENIEIIEVQTGTYFGEDDIIRIEDDYQRG